jgi:DNA-binding transcriptional LysR family regulator
VVRLALVASASVRIAPAVLTRARAWPGLAIRLLVGTDAEVSDWVANGAADLGLTFDTDQGEAVLDDRFHAIAARHGGPPPATPADFAGLPFIMPASGCEPMIRRILAGAGIAPEVVLTAHDTATLFALVGAGHGVSLVPGLCFPAGWEATITRHGLGPEADQPLRLIGDAAPAAASLVARLIRQAASEAAVSLPARPAPEGSHPRSPLRDRPKSGGIPRNSPSARTPRDRRTTAR